MRKRVVLVLATLSLLTGLFVVTAPPAAAIDVYDLWGCTPYSTLASVSSSGHRLSTQGTVCLEYRGPGVLGTNQWDVVTRFKCYRDGVLFGDGTGGCRWAWYMAQERSTPGSLSEFHAWPGDGLAGYWSDSGRDYGAFLSSSDGTSIRGCIRNGQVHFMGITGIDYGLFNMVDRCTAWRKAAV
jgi:hypothetical protein